MNKLYEIEFSLKKEKRVGGCAYQNRMGPAMGNGQLLGAWTVPRGRVYRPFDTFEGNAGGS